MVIASTYAEIVMDRAQDQALAHMCLDSSLTGSRNLLVHDFPRM